MPPVPDIKGIEGHVLVHDRSHRYISIHNAGPSLQKRGINLNPFHYLTLPLKNNWSTVGPNIQKYRNAISVVAVILSGIVTLTFLEQRNWSLPRWPWANDGGNNPKPSIKHPNEIYTTDEYTEKLLLEALEEMQKKEGLEEAVEEEVVREAEEEVVEDAEEGAEDIIDEDIEEGLDNLG